MDWAHCKLFNSRMGLTPQVRWCKCITGRIPMSVFLFQPSLLLFVESSIVLLPWFSRIASLRMLCENLSSDDLVRRVRLIMRLRNSSSESRTSPAVVFLAPFFDDGKGTCFPLFCGEGFDSSVSFSAFYSYSVNSNSLLDFVTATARAPPSSLQLMFKSSFGFGKQCRQPA